MNKKHTMDRKIINLLLFETEENAQKILDKHYPGYSTEVEKDGSGIIYDDVDKEIVKIDATNLDIIKFD